MACGYSPSRATVNALSSTSEAKTTKLWARLAPIELLAEQDRDRVRFLAGGASGHPDPQLRVGIGVFHERADDLRLERRPRVRVAEEHRHRDQQVVQQLLRLGGAGTQERQVLVDRQLVRQLHAPRQPPQHRAALVLREIVAGALPQHVEHVLERPVVGGRRDLGRPGIGLKLHFFQLYQLPE